MRFTTFSFGVMFGAVAVAAYSDASKSLIRREVPGEQSTVHHEDHHKIERQAQWAERIERHEATMHEHGAERSEGHGKSRKQQMQAIVEQIKTDIRAEAKDQKATDGTSKTACKKNTFIADWGSTGARIYLMHSTTSDDPTEFDSSKFGHEISIKEYLKLKADKNDVADLLETLKGELADGAEPMMAALATAGNRLERKESNNSWKQLATANKATKVLQDCTEDKAPTSKGCRTLPGATEAEYEYNSAYSTAEANSGMISSGGASLQMAFKVAESDQATAAECVSEITKKTLDTHTEYVEKAASYLDKKKLLTLSWLAVRWELEPTTFGVGGNNEMRASFEKFVEGKGHTKHPCLKGPWPKDRYADDKGSNATGQWTGTGGASERHEYLTDNRRKPEAIAARAEASYYTRLQGDPAATTANCEQLIKEFVKKDHMMKAFQSGKCKVLADKVQNWKLISAIYHAFKKSDFAGPQSGDDFKNKWNAYHGNDALTTDSATYSTFLERAMFYEVMKQTGVLTQSNKIAASAEGNWLLEAGKGLTTKLAPGWLANDCSHP